MFVLNPRLTKPFSVMLCMKTERGMVTTSPPPPPGKTRDNYVWKDETCGCTMVRIKQVHPVDYLIISNLGFSGNAPCFGNGVTTYSTNCPTSIYAEQQNKIIVKGRLQNPTAGSIRFLSEQ